MKDQDPMEDKYKNFLIDLVTLLKEKALRAKKKKDSSSSHDLDYKLGYLMAFYETIDDIKQQAKAFGIKQDELGLNRLHPDKDLL